MFERPI